MDLLLIVIHVQVDNFDFVMPLRVEGWRIQQLLVFIDGLSYGTLTVVAQIAVTTMLRCEDGSIGILREMEATKGGLGGVLPVPRDGWGPGGADLFGVVVQSVFEFEVGLVGSLFVLAGWVGLSWRGEQGALTGSVGFGVVCVLMLEEIP